MCRMIFLALLLGLCMFHFASAQESRELALNAMSFNIRYDNPRDGRNAWPQRRDIVAEIIKSADLAGLQEAQKNQIDDLVERLPEFAWTGVGRDDGQQRGEFTPIFFRRERFELLDQGAFWLSETPAAPGSKSWDAAITRVAAWAKLKDKHSGNLFYAFNTHFDHVGAEARENSSTLIRSKILQIAHDAPIVLTGDFNCTPRSAPYAILVGKSKGAAGNLQLRDAKETSASPPTGPGSTWNGFEEIVPGRRIDFIFIGGGVKVLSHRTIDRMIDDRFPSDHLPVAAQVEFAAP